MYKNISKNKLELLKKLCSMIIFHRIKSYSLLFLNFAFSIFWLLAALFPFLHNSNQSTSFQKEKPTKKAPIFGWCFIYLTLFTLILSPSHCFLMFTTKPISVWCPAFLYQSNFNFERIHTLLVSYLFTQINIKSYF